MKEINENETVQPSHHTITLDSLAYGGDAVGHIDDRVAFVPDGVPGDVARISVKEDRGSFIRGTIDEIITPSPERIDPFCPHASRCGGCQWQSVAYPAQLEWKRKIVGETLRRIGGVDGVEPEECLPSPQERKYRTSARYPARVTSKGLIFGYFERRSHRIVDIDVCPVASERVNEIASHLRSCIPDYCRDADIREIEIHASQNDPSALLRLTTGRHAKLGNAAEHILEAIPGLGGVIHHGPNGFLRLYGDPHRSEIICGKRFRIEARSFFQINVSQAERLVSLAGEMLDLEKGNTVVDGYGGVGLFSLCIAPSDTRIISYDRSKHSVKDSVVNARDLGFTSFNAYCKNTPDAAEIIGHADRIILDPPRTGLGKTDVEAITGLDAAIIVYISCNPATLARDLKLFAEIGYLIERIVPVDMFPHTYHIETSVKLVKE
ncbi:23S rRNA (uracil-C(5))-methyltransferase RlmCD [subsurface metagenome]